LWKPHKPSPLRDLVFVFKDFLQYFVGIVYKFDPDLPQPSQPLMLPTGTDYENAAECPGLWAGMNAAISKTLRK
jgi:hypothetical protein